MQYIPGITSPASMMPEIRKALAEETQKKQKSPQYIPGITSPESMMPEIRKALEKESQKKNKSLQYIPGMTSPESMMPDIRKALAKEAERKAKSRQRSAIWFLGELVLAGLVTYILFGVVFGIAIVSGDSMKPGLQTGNLIFFLRLDKQPQRGSLVIFTAESGKNYLVKRVIARGGDTVDINNASGALHVNGKAEKASYAIGRTSSENSTLTYPLTVPVESIFVLGDNREDSIDSRELGAINLRRVIGTSLWVLK